MKSVTAFVGSARKHGVTHRATRRFLDDLQAFGDVRSELLFLSEFDIRLCRGCKACWKRSAGRWTTRSPGRAGDSTSS